MKLVPLLAALLLTTNPLWVHAAESAPANAHKAYKLKLSACNASAKDQKLTGDEMRKYVADCVRQTPTPPSQQPSS